MTLVVDGKGRKRHEKALIVGEPVLCKECDFNFMFNHPKQTLVNTAEKGQPAEYTCKGCLEKGGINAVGFHSNKI